MADRLDFNHGGATHPGARAIVHPAADSGVHVVRYRVLVETDEHITLDDGYTYDKRTGALRGPAGRPTLQNRVAATEGSAMFSSWTRLAREPPRRHHHHTPRRCDQAPGRASQRRFRAVLRFLGRR